MPRVGIPFALFLQLVGLAEARGSYGQPALVAFSPIAPHAGKVGIRENTNFEENKIRQTGTWRGLLAAFSPSCLSSRMFDLNDDCAEAFPVYFATLALIVVVSACSWHGFCRSYREYSAQRRVERAAMSNKEKNKGSECPQGHALIRHPAPGGRKGCDNCHKKVEYVWGCRECKWGLCHNCHIELLASHHMGGTGAVEMTTQPQPIKPMIVEVVLTMEILIEQGANVHKWFDEQILEQAQKKGIADEFLSDLDHNVEVFDALGGIYGSYMEFAEKISPDKFPIQFKFSTHATQKDSQPQTMDRNQLLRRASQELEELS